MVHAAQGLADAGWSVQVCVPEQGPLLAVLDAVPNVSTKIANFPVLRKAMLAPLLLIQLLIKGVLDVARIMRIISATRPDLVYVNTVTLPWWVLAARLCRRPVLVHVREAEEDWPRAIRLALNAPLLLANAVLANSCATQRALVETVPRLAARTSVIYNGMPGPATDPGSSPPPAGADAQRISRVVLVGRLSPRKGVDVALEAIALLRADGYRVQLDVCGSVFPGYEWFEERLRARAEESDLAGSVRFLGYVNPTWPVLADASVVLVPSRVEPFGNTAVEGLLAGRPVVASAVQGLVEIIDDGRTGLLVVPGDPRALADAIRTLLEDDALATRLAAQGRADALRRFSLERYRRDVVAAVAAVAGKSERRRRSPDPAQMVVTA
jgi:glycosyltransferase involved in cell wall biosynthesis